MFCPKCKAGYRDESENVQILTSIRSPNSLRAVVGAEPEYIEYEGPLSTFNIGDIALLKSILDSEGIIHFFQRERFILMGLARCQQN